MSKERFNKGKSMDDAPVPTNGNDRPRPGDLVDVFDIPEKWTRMRFFGPVFPYGGHWVKTTRKDGKEASFYVTCSSFDKEEGKRDSTKRCAWCEHKGDKEEVRFAMDYWSNAIIRSLQKSKPTDLPRLTKSETAEGFKEKDSDSWTPVRAVRTTPNTLNMLKGLKPLNIVEGEDGETVGYAISHAKFGCDVMLKQDKKAAPANRYQLQKSDQKAMSKEEKAYLIYDLSELQETPDYAESKVEYDKWYGRMNKGQSPEGDDEDEVPRKKKRHVDEDDEPPRKKKRVVDEDDEDDEPPPKKSKRIVDEDDEDDEPPSRKKGKPPVDDFDDEDDEPPAKKKPTAKKRVVDEDDEDDEDEPPPRKKAPAKKKPVDDFDDEEDDEPPPKKKKRPVVEDEDDEDDEPPRKAAPKKKAAPVEDDEDDEPPPKKKAAPKKRVVDEDEDEDDEPPPRRKKKVVDEDEDDDL